MNKQKIRIVLLIAVMVLLGVTPKVMAKDELEIDFNTNYNDCYTFEELKEKGEIKTELKEEDKIEDKLNLERATESSQLSLGGSAQAQSTSQYEDIPYTVLYGNIINLYVPADTKSDYFIENSYGNYYKVIKHDIKTNTNTTIYTSKDKYACITTYIRNNIIYIEEALYKSYNEGNYSQVSVIGFDVLTNKVVYQGTFNVPVDQDDYFPTFAVDSRQRFYFVYDYTGTRVFDNEGKVIYDKKPLEDGSSVKREIVIHSITPNDEGIIFSLGYYSWPPYAYLKTDHQGFQRLNADGTFKQDSYTLFANSFGTYYVEDPDWKFLDKEGIYAVNQYGQIGKFDYTADNICGVKIQIIDDTLRNVVDANDGHLKNPAYFIKDNYLYLVGAENIIFVYDMNKNFERIGKIVTGISDDSAYDELYRITNIDNYIYVKYYVGSTSKRYDRKININSIEQFENIWYMEHITQTHSKKDVIEKYKKTIPTFNYSNNMYSVNPSYKAPYVAGKLQDGVATDTLNQINYFRWLFGINEVTINTDKMERSQKGAVIQAAIDTLSHRPSKPSDMDDEFYKEAYAGCYASSKEGDSYNGNCAFGDASPVEAVKGFVSDLDNVTIGSYIGHRLNLLDLDATKTSFGYCNRYTALSMYYGEEENTNKEQFYAYPSAGNFPMQSFVTSEYWSFHCQESYVLKNLKIEFTYNNKTYTQSEFMVEDMAIVFKLPDELIKILGGERKQMPKAKINVKLTGLLNVEGDTVNYQYDVNFFDVNEILITGISFANKDQVGYQGRMLQAQTVKILPTNATEEYEVIWSSSNTSVATIDSNGNITCKKIGTTVITAKVGEYTASYTLNVKEAPPYTLGDINNDGKINARDAKLALQYYVGKIKLTETQKLSGDVNLDGKVNARDAKLILQYYVGKIKKF